MTEEKTADGAWKLLKERVVEMKKEKSAYGREKLFLLRFDKDTEAGLYLESGRGMQYGAMVRDLVEEKGVRGVFDLFLGVPTEFDADKFELVQVYPASGVVSHN